MHNCLKGIFNNKLKRHQNVERKKIIYEYSKDKFGCLNKKLLITNHLADILALVCYRLEN